MHKKLILAGCGIAVLAAMSLAMKDVWYVPWIFGAMIVLGYLRTRHLSDWAEKQIEDSRNDGKKRE